MSKELTEKQQLFLNSLFGEANGDYRKAMNTAGYSPSTQITDVLKGLREEILDHARNLLAINAPKAALGIVSVLENPEDKGSKERMRAAEQILDRIGLTKVEKLEIDTKVSGAIFLLPPKDA